MSSPRRLRLLMVASALYLAFSAVAGILIGDNALHPHRRPLTQEEKNSIREDVSAMNAQLKDVLVTSADGAVLRAWLITPSHSNGNAVILLHGLGDNRVGITGYAKLFLSHGFVTLLPDARAHGESGGDLATYGVLERNDIKQWFDFLALADRPQCIFGFGESMGAAQLLQALGTSVHFCAVAAESSFSSFREIAYDRMGQPFHLGPWFGKTVLRPVVEAAFLRARWKYKLDMLQAAPELSIKDSPVPILLIHGQLDSNIPVRHSRRIHEENPTTILWEVPGADHCGAISAAPQEFQQRLINEFSRIERQPRGTESWQLSTGN